MHVHTQCTPKSKFVVQIHPLQPRPHAQNRPNSQTHPIQNINAGEDIHALGSRESDGVWPEGEVSGRRVLAWCGKAVGAWRMFR
eukprot:858421-Amorphochlora_amoeboformis.AAC.1